MLVALTVVLVAGCGWVVFRSVVRVRPDERVVVERGGRFDRVLEPGTHWVVPFVQRARLRVDTRPQEVALPARERRTADGLGVVASARLVYRVVDARSATYAVPHLPSAIAQLAGTTLDVALEGTTADSAVRDGHGLRRELLAVLSDTVRPWGVDVHSVEVVVGSS
ncbi:SPFH domain-containing protein [Spiractinospora alimapuensis]|uniref:SPFH domain-containing protein n=1 Tax=Spiractinospora alimapuensis TaxID=2820884 RepID=UPI001F399CA1|nr:SPFH domain-containing protein [Spiractinospora alimapuensis]QVQ52371.1 SPFH domain-containing protein [Spiractinospora alimapuensis]